MKKSFQNAVGKRVEVTNSMRKKIVNFYANVAEDLRKQAEALEGKTISDYRRKVILDSIEYEIKSNINHLYDTMEESIVGSMRDVSKVVVSDNLDMVKGMGFDINVAYANVPRDVINEILSGKLYEGRWSLSKAIWGDNKAILSEIDTVIANGIAMQKSTFEIAKDLERFVNPSAAKSWDWSVVYPGVRKKIDYNAQMLARTMISHAYQESFVRTTQNNPFIDAYQWLISNSDRVCPICIDRAEEDSYGLGAGIFPKDQLPLDHPNGMCTFVVTSSMSSVQMGEALADWVMGVGSPSLNKQLDIFAEDMKNF